MPRELKWQRKVVSLAADGRTSIEMVDKVPLPKVHWALQAAPLSLALSFSPPTIATAAQGAHAVFTAFLGNGAVATVFSGTVDGIPVAIKIARTDDSSLAALRREAAIYDGPLFAAGLWGTVVPSFFGYWEDSTGVLTLSAIIMEEAGQSLASFDSLTVVERFVPAVVINHALTI